MYFHGNKGCVHCSFFFRREYVAKFVTFDDDEGPSVTHLWGFFWDLVKKNKEIHDVSEFSTVAD